MTGAEATMLSLHEECLRAQKSEARMRAALDKIIGVALGRTDFPAALVHRIAHDALGDVEQSPTKGE